MKIEINTLDIEKAVSEFHEDFKDIDFPPLETKEEQSEVFELIYLKGIEKGVEIVVEKAKEYVRNEK